PYRTDVDHVAGVLVVEHLARREVEVDVIAALIEGELAGVRHLIDEAHAARAEDAALLIEDDERPDRLRLLLVDLLRQRDAAALPVVVHVVFLELALARLVAHGTVDRVVDEQELEHRPLGGVRLLAGGVHDHAVGHPRVAGDLELRALLDVDQAHPAVPRDRQAGVPAVVWDLDAQALGGLDHRLPVGDLDAAAVDLNRGHAQAPERTGRGSGRGWHAARTRPGTWSRRRALAWRRRRRARRSSSPSCCRRC